MASVPDRVSTGQRELVSVVQDGVSMVQDDVSLLAWFGLVYLRASVVVRAGFYRF